MALKHTIQSRIRKNTLKVGLPPGTLVAPKDAPPDKIKITLFEFSENSLNEKELDKIEDCSEAIANKNSVKWIDVDGIHKVDMIEKIGKYFDIHPLTLEDIMNPDQRPKFEDYDDYTLSVLKMLNYKEYILSEQLSIVLMKNVVITFQEHHSSDAFGVIRERLRAGKGRVRKMSADYLAYALLDSVVDTYFVILEKLGDKIEKLEEEVIHSPSQRTLDHIHHLKREMIFLRKAIWPLREMIHTMQRCESELFSDHTHVYLRDLYDHCVRIIETVETYRDLLSGMMDIYHSVLSNKMNEIMKVLTIISSVFIPVTFIAGVYGMNFHHMPELRSKWGYPLVWMAMIAVVAGMLYYFRRKKWL